jgi:hypothetical protein
VAIPESATVGGLPAGTLRVAERIPGVVVPGMNMTPIWQLFPAATGLGVQDAGEVKSAAFGPEIAIPVISAAEAPVFRIVTFCRTLAIPSLCAGNVRLDGDTCSDGGEVAFPVTLTC